MTVITDAIIIDIIILVASFILPYIYIVRFSKRTIPKKYNIFVLAVMAAVLVVCIIYGSGHPGFLWSRVFVFIYGIVLGSASGIFRKNKNT